jgi:hypothetical protein
MVASRDDFPATIKRFRSFTAKQLLQLLQDENVKTILDQLAFYKKAHKGETTYRLWQEGYQSKLLHTSI